MPIFKKPQTASSESLYSRNGRAKPEQMMKYKHALELYKIYNANDMNDGWLDLNFNQSFGNRCTSVRVFEDSHTRIGKKHLDEQNDMHQQLNTWVNLSLT